LSFAVSGLRVIMYGQARNQPTKPRRTRRHVTMGFLRSPGKESFTHTIWRPVPASEAVGSQADKPIAAEAFVQLIGELPKLYRGHPNPIASD